MVTSLTPGLLFFSGGERVARAVYDDDYSLLRNHFPIYTYTLNQYYTILFSLRFPKRIIGIYIYINLQPAYKEYKPTRPGNAQTLTPEP